MLGGSAAFGYPASEDDTTVTGYLNEFQDKLTFVNAGVPNFTSTQELLRLHHQITSFHPNLVISYTIFNDIEQAIQRARDRKAIDFPPGTPEDYGRLLSILKDAQHPSLRTSAIRTLVPKTSRLLMMAWEQWGTRKPSRPYRSNTQALEAAVDAEVDLFIRNQKAMFLLSADVGARFLTVIQPMTQTHHNAVLRGPDSELYRRAVERALRSNYCKTHCLDYSRLYFDMYFQEVRVIYKNYQVPILLPSETLNDIVFADACHLLDRGNEIVAQNLINDLDLKQIAKRN